MKSQITLPKLKPKISLTLNNLKDSINTTEAPTTCLNLKAPSNESSILTFLKARKANKGQDYTHTNMSQPLGCFNISLQDKHEMYQLLSNHLFENNNSIGLTECNQTITPIKIDLDFKYPAHDLRRRHTTQTLKDIVQLYNLAIQHHLKDIKLDKLTAVIFERNTPYLCKGQCKDGIHIMYPMIACHTQIQHLIRLYVLDRCQPIFNPLNTLNTLQDIVDKSVISSNNWIMFGCSKPNCEPYKITHSFDFELDEVDIMSHLTHPELIHAFSIRDVQPNLIYQPKNEFPIQTPTTIPQKPLVHGIKLSPRQDQPINQIWLNALKSSPYWQDHFQVIETTPLHMKLHAQLPYDCILCQRQHIANNNHPLLFQNSNQIWFLCRPNHQVLLQSNGLPAGLCLLNDDTVTDFVPDHHIDVITSTLKMMTESKDTATFTMGMIVANFFKDRWKFVDTKNQIWYSCDPNTKLWTHDPHAIKLNQAISLELVPLVNQLIRLLPPPIEISTTHTNKKGVRTTEITSQDPHQSQRDKYENMISAFTNIGSKSKYISEAKAQLYQPNFTETLDTLGDLFSCPNGVYDLLLHKFRPRSEQDYITKVAGFNFDPQINLEKTQQCWTFLRQILPNPIELTHVLDCIASALNGRNNNELFHILIGKGRNGKSKLLLLMEKMFGKYHVTLPSTLFTTKAGGSHQANPALMVLAGARTACFSEPEENSELNMALFKLLTGRDTVTGRGLYQDMFNFTNRAIIFGSCNSLPRFSDQSSNAIKERITLTQFKQFFTKPNEQGILPHGAIAIDPALETKILSWTNTFFHILIQRFTILQKNNYTQIIPQIIKENYEDISGIDVHPLQTFINDKINITNNPNDFIPRVNLYTSFQTWARDDLANRNLSTKDFNTQISKFLTFKTRYRAHKDNPSNVFINCLLKTPLST
jgi:P4 family phage/plasmid primase-like protien